MYILIFKLDNNLNQINAFKKLIIHSIKHNLSQDFIPVLFTSREIVSLENKNELIQFQNFLSVFIAEIVSAVKNQFGYLISKGGLTTNTIISKGLEADLVYLEGQILPGISLVTFNLSKEKGRLPIVTFPGNIGNNMSLVKALEIIENKNF